MKIELNKNNFEKIKEHYLSLDKESRYLRFFTHKNDYAINSWLSKRDNSDLFYVFADNNKIVGLLHLVKIENDYEVGISVLSDYRGMGIAKKLINEAIIDLEKTPDSKLIFISHPHNMSMLKIANSFGVKPEFNGSEYYWKVDIGLSNNNIQKI